MTDDPSPHAFATRTHLLPPRITLYHGAVDSAFAARLARDLLNMYGAEAIQLVGPGDRDDADPSAQAYSSDAQSDNIVIHVILLSPVAISAIESMLDSGASLAASDQGKTVVITAIVRACTIPERLAGRRTISFEEPWRYDLSLAELLDVVRRGDESATADAVFSTQTLLPTETTAREETNASPTTFVPRVFISHNSADNAFGLDLERQLKAALGSADAVFYDSDGGPSGLLGGDEWLKRLQHEITERNVFVLLLSPRAFTSPWVDQELSLALRQAVSAGGKVIIPVLYQETPVWPFVANFQFVDFTNTVSFEAAFADLLAAVRLGHSRRREVGAMRQERLGPPFDVDLLPLPARFIGRDADLDWALQRLDPATLNTRGGTGITGLASIAAANGLAGIGKSALAGQVVRILHATHRFPDGIAVVLCNGLTDPTEVLRRVLARFDPQGREPEAENLQQARDLTRQILAGQRALVVLDNVEPEWPVEQVVQPLRVAGISALLTSRHRLPVAAVPPVASRMLELLAPDEARDLFAEYYGRGSALALTSAERELVDTIVAALGSHTLAVKLAAVRAGGRDLPAVAREYTSDLRLRALRDGSEAVEVVLASTVAALPPAAQRLFAVFGAFKSGDMERQALLTVGGTLGDPAAERSLDALLDLRLLDPYVFQDAPEGSARERLKLHPLVAEYAGERFGSLPKDEQLQMRRIIAQWYAGWLVQEPDQTPQIDDVNIEASSSWALEARQYDLVAIFCTGMLPRQVSGMSFGIYSVSTRVTFNRAWYLLAPAMGPVDNRKYITAAVLAARATGTKLDRLRADNLALRLSELRELAQGEDWLEPPGPIDREGEDHEDAFRAGCLQVLSYQAALFYEGVYVDESLAEETLRFVRATHDQYSEVAMLYCMGILLGRRHQLMEARRRLEEARAIVTDLDNHQQLGAILNALGDILTREQDVDAAETMYAEAVDTCHQGGYAIEEVYALFRLSQVHRTRGRKERATALADQALEKLANRPTAPFEGLDELRLGQRAQLQGDAATAAQQYQAGLTYRAGIWHDVTKYTILLELGAWAAEDGRWAEAERFVAEALTLQRSASHGSKKRDTAELLLNLGSLANAQGAADRERAYYQEVAEMYEGIDPAQANERWYVDGFISRRDWQLAAEAHLRLSHMAQDEGRLDEALRLLLWNVDTRIEEMPDESRLESLIRAAILQFTLGRIDEAERYCQETRRLAITCRAPAFSGTALSFLATIAEQRDQFELADRYHRRSIAHFHRANATADEAAELDHLGASLLERGKALEARRIYETCLARARDANDGGMAAQALGNLGTIAFTLGEFDSATDHLHASVQEARALQDPHLEGVGLGYLGQVAHAQQRLDEARALLGDSLELLRETDDRASEGAVLTALGDLARVQDDPAQAGGWYREALTLAERDSDHVSRLDLLLRLGDVSQTQNQAEEAEQWFRQGEALAQSMADTERERTFADHLLQLRELRP